MHKKSRLYTPIKRGKWWNGWGWFVIPDWNITIAAPPKAGSTTLKRFFRDSDMDNVKMVPRYQVNPNSEIYFVVRNPLDRFKSLWRSKCRDAANIKNYSVCGMKPNELMEHILEGNRDVHWTHQLTLLDGLEVNLIPLELLDSWWQQCGYGELERTNITEGEVEIDDELREQILTFYADDVELYRDALKLQLKQ